MPQQLTQKQTDLLLAEVVQELAARRFCAFSVARHAWTATCAAPFRARRKPTWGNGKRGLATKHTLNGNSLKLYDQAYTALGSVLRPEMTMNNEADFRLYRPKEGDPQGPKTWRILRAWRR